MKWTKNDKKWFEDKFELIRVRVLHRASALKIKDKKTAKLGHDLTIELLHEIFENGYSLGYNTAQGEFTKEMKKLERDNEFPNIGDRRG